MSTFSYSGNPATSARDEVRFLIGDTDETCMLLSDVELDYLVAKWLPLYGSALFIAAVAAKVISNRYAGTVTVGEDGLSAQVGELQQRYADLSDRLMADYRAEGDVGGLVNLENILADTSWDPEIEPLEFAMRLDDNDRAGKQNWGGRLPHLREEDVIGEVGAL